MVGFQPENGKERFAFGEVKTSSHTGYPPTVMYGRTGLKQQIEDLRDSRDVRDDLVKYLAHRAQGKEWMDRYKSAAKSYLENHRDVAIFGVLIRDVPPNGEDLRVRSEKLAKDCPNGFVIELLAIYIGQGRISNLARDLIATRKGTTP